MSATEKLRRLLDERRVEYRADDAKTVWATHWEFGEHSSAMFSEYDDGECVFVTSRHLWTPEQAVDATLGRGECRITSAILIHDPDGYETTLDCGHVVHMPPEDFDYCPSCGKKVADDCR